MADILLDVVTDDIDLSTGGLQLVTGIDAILQNSRIRFRFFKGEWFLNTTEGIPYFENILIKNPNSITMQSIFRQVILTTEGIASLSRFNLDTSKVSSERKARLSYTAVSDTGEIIEFDREFVINV